MNSKLRALVVDDDLAVRRYLVRYLTTKGWDVTETASGIDSLERIKKDNFDIVFIDVNLGEEVDGIEIAQRIKDRGSNIKILVMSGDVENEARVLKLKLGIFLKKPISSSDLEAAIGQYFEIK